MKNIIFASIFALGLTACDVESQTQRTVQSHKAAEAANQIQFSSNAEIDNIVERIKLTSNPGQIGFILLINQAGQPIMYTSVKGKLTSGTKRLNPPDRMDSYSGHALTRAAPSDEGTWGSSSEYIFWWTQEGQYMQWNGSYLYSDKPFRLKVEPLVISIKEQPATVVVPTTK